MCSSQITIVDRSGRLAIRIAIPVMTLPEFARARVAWPGLHGNQSAFRPLRPGGPRILADSRPPDPRVHSRAHWRAPRTSSPVTADMYVRGGSDLGHQPFA